jgi:hypothetical protein
MIEEKHQLVDLLTRSIEATGLTVIMGLSTVPDLRLSLSRRPSGR